MFGRCVCPYCRDPVPHRGVRSHREVASGIATVRVVRKPPPEEARGGSPTSAAASPLVERQNQPDPSCDSDDAFGFMIAEGGGEDDMGGSRAPP
jgi:hypothetical protein